MPQLLAQSLKPRSTTAMALGVAMAVDKLARAIERIIERLRTMPWSILGIVAIGGLLRVVALGREGLWFDEVNTVLMSRESLSGIVQHMGQPPLYCLILHFWMLAFGESDVALQSLSVVIGILCIPLMYLIGAELFDKRTGLIAALLLAVSAMAILESLEVRMYSLLLLLTLLSFLFFIRILMADRPRKTHVLCYSISNVLLGLTQLYVFFTIGTQILYFVLFHHRYTKAKVPFWSAQAITLIAFGAAIVPFIRLFRAVAVGSRAGDVPPFSGPIVLDQLGFFCGAYLASILIPIFGVLCLMALFRFSGTQAQGHSRESAQTAKNSQVRILLLKPKIALLLLWLLVPLITSLAISVAWEPIFRGKYLIGVLPALLLLTARGMLRTSSFFKRYVMRLDVTYILLTAIVLLSLLGVLIMHANPQREQWREAASFVEQASQPDDAILVSPAGYRHCFVYYYKGIVQTVGVPLTGDNQTLRQFVDQVSTDKGRLWLVLLTYVNTKDAPITPYLIARYGSNSVIQKKEFLAITVYLFDLQTKSS